MSSKELNIHGKDYFTLTEAAHYAGVSVKYFRAQAVSMGIMPRYFGSRRLYSREEIRDAIELSVKGVALPR